MFQGNRFTVIGLGQYGSTIARSLAKKGAEVYCADISEDKVEDVKDDVAGAVVLDSTSKKMLLSQNLHEVDAAVVAIGENFQAVILTALNLLELGTKRVIARASGRDQKLILEKIGVQEILTPEDEVASSITEKLLNPSVVASLPLPDGFEIAEIKPPKELLDSPLGKVKFDSAYNLRLIAMKRETTVMQGDTATKKAILLHDMDPSTMIYETDTLIVFGRLEHIERFIEVKN